MGILTLLRNAFGRSRKGRTAEAEGAAQSPEPTSTQVPEPRTSSSEEHELVSAAFDNITVPKQATEPRTTSPEPAAKPAAEPVTEPEATDPAAQADEPAAEAEAKPVAEAEAKPVAEAEVAEPVAEAVEAEPEAEVVEPAAETPVAEASEPVAEPEAKPVAEAEVAEPAAEAVEAEPEAEVVEPEAEVVEPAAETPVAEASEPVAEPEAKPVAEAEVAEPVAEAEAPEPVAEPVEAEPEAETVEPAAETETEAVAEVVEPAAEAEAKTEAEPAAEATAEPEPAEAPQAADGEDAPQGPLAADDETRTGGAGGNDSAEGEAEATAKPAPATPLTKIKSRTPSLTTAYKAATTTLKKTDLTGTRAKLYLVLDRSASMRPYYKDGSAQALADQTLALAAHLDPEATVHVVFFSTEVDGTTDLTLDADHETRIDDVHAGLGRMGRTSYHAAVEAVLAHHEKNADPAAPALVIFQTDGAPDAKTPATQSLTEAAKNHPSVFFSFVAFGEHDNKAFDYLRKLKTDNTSFFHAGPTPRELTDTELYEGVLAAWRP
ncbi:VWA domain-containing protein [Streptomyces collinus]|uniref:VWA domain-containing protein n=1 Tax=Streptomyces collinus TaxID=42684 RepID=UPI0036A0AA6D